MFLFQNRQEAGQLLAKKLKKYQDLSGAEVWALLRGGVVVGKEIAQKLHLPLFPLPIKKIGAPTNPELALGAVSQGTFYLNQDLIKRLGVEKEYLKKKIKEHQEEIKNLGKKFSLLSLPQDFSGKKIFLLTDDGVATGATVLAAIAELRKRKRGKMGKIVLAVPVIAKETYQALKEKVEEMVALEVSEDFGAVGEFYRDFSPVEEEEVRKILFSL